VNHAQAESPINGHDVIGHDELVATVTNLLDRIRLPAPSHAGPAPDRDEAVERALNAAIGAEHRIAQLQQRIDQLEKLAVTDELTGLLNRRGFESQLRRTLALARRHGEPGLLVYVDLDGFKMVNDSYGHAAGDEVLKHVGRVLSDHVRATDFVGRLGGDEFAVLLPRTSSQNGARRARALRRLLNPAMIFWNGGTLTVGASFGMEAYDGDPGRCAEAVLSRADSAMYAHKRLRTAPRADSMMS
jgi:diguanylate cyclase (GGDEF)-like protein